MNFRISSWIFGMSFWVCLDFFLNIFGFLPEICLFFVLYVFLKMSICKLSFQKMVPLSESNLMVGKNSSYLPVSLPSRGGSTPTGGISCCSCLTCCTCINLSFLKVIIITVVINTTVTGIVVIVIIINIINTIFFKNVTSVTQSRLRTCLKLYMKNQYAWNGFSDINIYWFQSPTGVLKIGQALLALVSQMLLFKYGFKWATVGMIW